MESSIKKKHMEIWFWKYNFLLKQSLKAVSKYLEKTTKEIWIIFPSGYNSLLDLYRKSLTWKSTLNTETRDFFLPNIPSYYCVTASCEVGVRRRVRAESRALHVGWAYAPVFPGRSWLHLLCVVINNTPFPLRVT